MCPLDVTSISFIFVKCNGIAQITKEYIKNSHICVVFSESAHCGRKNNSPHLHVDKISAEDRVVFSDTLSL